MNTTKTKPEIIALYELSISVEPDGVLVRLDKYAVKFTGKNYCPVMITDDLEDQKFRHGLSSRVPAEEINKVRRVSFHDSANHIGRSVYFLEGNLDTVKAAIKKEIEETVTRMRKQVNDTYSAWTEQKMRPPR